VGFVYWRNKAIAFPRNRLNIVRTLRFIAQYSPDLPDAVVQSLFEIDKRLSSPELTPQLLASHNPPRGRDQDCQNFEGLGLDAERYPTSSKLLDFEIQFEKTKPEDFAGSRPQVHSAQPRTGLGADYITAQDFQLGLSRLLIRKSNSCGISLMRPQINFRDNSFASRKDST